MTDPREAAVAWRRGPDAEWIADAEVEGRRWQVRLGDFPAEPLYTLVVDGEPLLSFDEWPAAWRRPPR